MNLKLKSKENKMPQIPLPRPPHSTIHFSKLEIENNILKFEIGSLKSKIKRLKKKLKKIKRK